MAEVGTSQQKEIATLSILQICKDNVAYHAMVNHEGTIPPLIALSQSSSARPIQSHHPHLGRACIEGASDYYHQRAPL
jgi:hypothetical protein